MRGDAGSCPWATRLSGEPGRVSGEGRLEVRVARLGVQRQLEHDPLAALTRQGERVAPASLVTLTTPLAALLGRRRNVSGLDQQGDHLSGVKQPLPTRHGGGLHPGKALGFGHHLRPRGVVGEQRSRWRAWRSFSWRGSPNASTTSVGSLPRSRKRESHALGTSSRSAMRCATPP